MPYIAAVGTIFNDSSMTRCRPDTNPKPPQQQASRLSFRLILRVSLDRGRVTNKPFPPFIHEYSKYKLENLNFIFICPLGRHVNQREREGTKADELMFANFLLICESYQRHNIQIEQFCVGL